MSSGRPAGILRAESQGVTPGGIALGAVVDVAGRDGGQLGAAESKEQGTSLEEQLLCVIPTASSILPAALKSVSFVGRGDGESWTTDAQPDGIHW